ncbi:MFS transporter [Kitasatospora sp. NBC_01250]|uniref:MFS transporter n=1 Tax=Kitasatospora sp. NBC_01250 TaxID=2903571 RepID=UPI002E338369|nr:MFS transporter [Kitasatospora sp. NBC_01250]
MTSTQPDSGRDSPGRNIGSFISAYTLSMTGDQLWLTALGWSAGQLGRPVLTGIVMGAGTVPRALLMLLGGSLVDRLGIRQLALSTQAARIAIMLGATLAAAAAPHAWVPLLAVALVFGAIDAINVPALGAVPALIAPPEQLPRVTGLLQTMQRVGTVAGGPAAGLLIALGGTAGATTACAVVFALALVALLRVRLPERPEPTEHTNTGAKAGIRYILCHPVLAILIVTIACLNFTIMGSFSVGLPLLIHNHHWPATTFGAIQGSFGAGAVIGAMTVVLRRPTRHAAVAGLSWVAFQTPLLVALGYVNQPVATALVAAAVGFTLGPASSLLIGLVQATADKSYIGRVMSLVSFTTVGLTPVSFLLFASIARATSISTAFLISGILEAIVVALALANPALRAARLPDPRQPDEAPEASEQDLATAK